MESKIIDGENLKLMIESLATGLVATDDAGNVMIINARARQILNTDEAALNNNMANIIELVDHSSKLHEELQNAFRSVFM